MTLRTLISTSLLVAAAVACGQSGNQATGKGRKSDEILDAMYSAQLLNQVLPLALTKEQVRKLLPPIERVREKARRLMEAEHAELLQYENRVQAAVNNGVEKGQMPPQEVLAEIAKYLYAVNIRRHKAIEENIDIVLEEMRKSLHKGQMTVAAKSLTLAFYAPDVKPEDATEEFRIRLFIRHVMLDPLTYQMLVRMSK